MKLKIQDLTMQLPKTEEFIEAASILATRNKFQFGDPKNWDKKIKIMERNSVRMVMVEERTWSLPKLVAAWDFLQTPATF